MTQPTKPNPSKPNPLFEKFSAQLQAHIKKAFQMGVVAAENADKEQLGIDERIKVWHRFVDLEVKGHAELLETLIAGPWITPCCPTEVSDTVKVPAANYPRKVKLGRNFWRVGWQTLKLSRRKLKATPEVLPAYATDIKITLLDLSYTGSNYRGRVKLRKAATGAAAPDPPEVYVVTVGL